MFAKSNVEMRWICMSFVMLLFVVCPMESRETEMTVSIDPGMEECFFHTLKFTQTANIDYQV
jgi:hypothetical protein